MEHPHSDALYYIDDRIEGYRSVGDTLGHLALRSGVDVDDTTLDRWRDLMGLMREFDTYVDEIVGDDSKAMAVLADFNFFRERYPTLDRPIIGVGRFDALLENTQTILEIGKSISRETDGSNLIDLRTAEAYYTAEMLRIAATDGVRDQEEFNTFMWHATGLGIAANLGDTMLDARTDFARGKTQFEPTWGFYRQVGRAVSRHAMPHMTVALHSETIRLRTIMLWRRISNRLRNGATPYSNLHIIEGLWKRRPDHDS